MSFALHPRLAADTVTLADWELSRLCLMDDARYPWLILVPRREGLGELHDLSDAGGLVLIEEIKRASEGLKRITGAARINMGALGNLVPQLHIHVVARNPGDAAWPGPVWGQGTRVPYAADAKEALIERLAKL